MRVTNPFSVKYWSIGKIIFVFWVLATTLFTFYVFWNMFLSSNSAYKKGLQEGQIAGQQAVVNQIVTLLQTNKCKPLPINNDIQVIDFACLQQPEATNPTAPAPVATDSSAE